MNLSRNSLVIYLFLVVACTHIQTNPLSESYWIRPSWEPQNPGKPYSMTLTHMDGRNSLRFEIRQGEAWTNPRTGNSTLRSEINTYEFVPMHSSNWYRFSIYLPKDFPIEDNRLCLAQWWAKTKTHLGEVHRSPILQLRFAAGKLKILLRRYRNKITINDEIYDQTNLYTTKDLSLAQWHDFIFHIKWSPKNDGYIQAWWNNKRIISFQGPTENQDEIGPSFKFGLYRDESPKTYVSYVSDVMKGDSAESIGFEVPR